MINTTLSFLQATTPCIRKRDDLNPNPGMPPDPPKWCAVAHYSIAPSYVVFCPPPPPPPPLVIFSERNPDWSERERVATCTCAASK